jgi:hypothetical protein
MYVGVEVVVEPWREDAVPCSHLNPVSGWENGEDALFEWFIRIAFLRDGWVEDLAVNGWESAELQG